MVEGMAVDVKIMESLFNDVIISIAPVGIIEN